MPHMNDPFFSKAVVYVCEHNKDGAMGMIINKQFDSDELREAFDELFSVDNSLDRFMKDIFLEDQSYLIRVSFCTILIIHLLNQSPYLNQSASQVGKMLWAN